MRSGNETSASPELKVRVPRPGAWCLAFYAALLFSGIARAQHVEITSPLGGYARAGRAVAVHVLADGLSGTTLKLFGEGMIPTVIPVQGGRVDCVVPLMAVADIAASLEWSDDKSSGKSPFTVHPLASNERLIAVVGDVPEVASLAATWFPDESPVLVKIETSRLRLLVPAAAYEAIDAIVLDSTAAARVDESQLRTFLAAGTLVMIRSPEQPTGHWPWVRAGHGWILRHSVAGPRSSPNADVYKPTYSWDRSWPIATRRASLLAATVVAILLIAATLWRGKRGFLAALFIAITSATAAGIYGRQMASAVLATGEIISWNGSLAQRDRWTYVSGIRESAVSVPFEGWTRPISGTRRQLDNVKLQLICAADGEPLRYDFALAANQTIAWISRTVSPDAPAAFAKPVTSPMALFADQLYPGELAGESILPGDTVGENWGRVVMTAKKRD